MTLPTALRERNLTKVDATQGVSPRVTIGMPVRNGGASLDATLELLTRQRHANFELLISDNESTDNTQEICERWQRRDSRINYFRQPSNLGAPLNFLYVLRQAKSPYFMWATHDDWWHPDFITENLAVLETYPEVVCSVSIVEIDGAEGSLKRMKAGADALMGESSENLYQFLRAPGYCSRFYGLFRTDVLRDCYGERDTYWGFDWVVMARTLTQGKHYQVPLPLMRRHANGMTSDSARWIPQFNRTWLSRRLPMLPLTREILADPRIVGKLRLLAPLWRWNVFFAKDPWRRFRRKWFRAKSRQE